MTLKIALAAAALTLAATGAAHAQRGGGTATLYELPGFQGRSVTITQAEADLGKWRFNDRAQSARFQGRWLACEHDDFRGKCQEIRGDVADLTTYGLMAQISSIAPAGFRDGPGPGGGYDRPGGGDGWGPRGPGGRDARGVDGERTVFFPHPTVRGVDVAAGKNGADTFCRRQGLGPSVWFDSGARASQAIGPEGQLVGRSSVIRDLLCAKY